MSFMPKYNSLKIKLIMYFTAIINVLSISISLFYYDYARDSLEQNIIDNSYTNIRYLMNNIDKQLKLCENFSDWIYINRPIGKVLIRDYEKEQAMYNIDIPAAQRLIDDRVASVSTGKYISSLIISGDNGVDLSTGSEADWINKTAVQSMDWFKAGIDKKGLVFWNGIVENPAKYRSDDYIIPIVRPIIFVDTGKKIGWSMVGFKPQIIADIFEEYTMDPDESLFVIDRYGKCVFHTNGEYIGQELNKYKFIDDILSKNSGHFITELQNKKTLIFFTKSSYSGLTIVHALSNEQLENQKAVVGNITLIMILLSIVISAAFTIFLSSRLTKPLRDLLNKMNAISKGNFERDLRLEGSDEMGMLGKGINNMVDNIKKLMNKIREEEEEKKKLEYKILQSQINPHFIYNTLNAIKLMATIQKSDGISEMASALGALLKEISKGTSEKIPIREEIDLIDKYIYLQKIRRKGMIKVEYHIEDPALYDYRVLKFTLQPIVENAVFHGLEAKKGVGTINIDVFNDSDEIIIAVQDNGVGMTEEKIKEVFCNSERPNRGKYDSIGIKNVDERIKLTYGDRYGLKIESREGEFTRVLIRIPKEI